MGQRAVSNAVRANSSAAVMLLQRNTDRMRPVSVTPCLAVHVLDGMHAGSVVQITAARLVLGAADDCDIVLYDDGIEERHATLTVSRSLLGDMLQIEAALPGVAVAGRPVRAGATEMLPAVITVAGVSLRVERGGQATSTAPKRQNSWLDRVVKVSALAVMLFAALIIGRMTLGTADGAMSLVPRLGIDATAASAGLVPDARIGALQEQIDTMGLGSFLTLAPMADATVAVRGTLPEHMVAAWDDVHEWYDTLEDPPLLTSQFARTPSLAGLPAIAMVRISESPEILFVSGQRSAVGDIVADGWTLDEIAADGLRLSRNGESVGVDY